MRVKEAYPFECCKSFKQSLSGLRLKANRKFGSTPCLISANSSASLSNQGHQTCFLPERVAGFQVVLFPKLFWQ